MYQAIGTTGCRTNSRTFSLTLHIMPVYFTKLNGWRNSSRTSWWKGISSLKLHPEFQSLWKLNPTAKVWWLTLQHANNITSQGLYVTSKQRHPSCTWKGQGYTFLHSLNSVWFTHCNYYSTYSLILYKSGIYESFRKFNQICHMKWVSLVFMWLMLAKRAEKTFKSSEETQELQNSIIRFNSVIATAWLPNFFPFNFFFLINFWSKIGAEGNQNEPQFKQQTQLLYLTT